jgi:hypothetical protein
MPAYARFGKPAADFVRGGAHVAVHLVPVYKGRIVAFDVSGPASGRWLPWDLLPYEGNPYETASELGDDWCDGAVVDLRVVDALSLAAPGESWELALVFRAELAAMPAGDGARSPVALDAGELGTVKRFDATELERWRGSGGGDETKDSGGKLVF